MTLDAMKTKLGAARSAMNLNLLKAKLKATGIHIGLSLLIFGVLLYLMLVHWYPGIYFSLDGGWQGVRIMLFVDVVLGPTLTFLVFNPAKTRRALTVDFTFIGVVQLVAVIWGIHAVYGQRPLVLAYNAAQLFTVRAASFKQQNFPLEKLREFDGDHWPVRVYAEPKDRAEGEKSLDIMFKTGLLEAQQVQLYQRWDQHLEEIFAASSPPKDVTKGKAKIEAELQALMQKLGGKAEDYRYLYFMGEYAEGWLVLDQKGEIVGTIDMVPF